MSCVTPSNRETKQHDLTSVLKQTAGVPFYQRADWAQALTLPCLQLDQLPHLTKEEFRLNSPAGFLPNHFDLTTLVQSGAVEEENTSGTSGTSVRVIFGATWWAEQEARALRQNHFIKKILENNPLARRAVFTTPGCSGVSCYARWLNYEQRIMGQTLFVNQSRIPFTIPEEKYAQMVEETLRWDPTFLDVDPVHGMAFALYCERHRVQFPSLRFILSSYEYTSVLHRRIMSRVFGVPVINLYGSSETGHLLIEKEDGFMTPSIETALLEIDSRQPSGFGQLLVTTLTNPYLPLIRYEIGDFVESDHRGYLVHGRIRDALLNHEGSWVTTRQIDELFHDGEGIAHYQLRQNTDGSCELLLLPEKSGDTLTQIIPVITQRLKKTLGYSVECQSVPLITPEDSGKFRLTARFAQK